MPYIAPRTNWTAEDVFNIEDFNRINGNIRYIRDLSSNVAVIPDFVLSDDVDDRKSVWNPTQFNNIENGLSKIVDALPYSFIASTTPMTFAYGGMFITYAELNRIESLIAEVAEYVSADMEKLTRLPFTLGHHRMFDRKA